MPGFDKKGPEGMGPMTGGGRGDCLRNAAGQGRGGKGRGAGRGRRGRCARDEMSNRSMKRGSGEGGMAKQPADDSQEPQPSQPQEKDKE